MAEAGQLGLGQLEAVALVVAPAAQVYRLALALLDLHPEQVDEEPQALLGERRQQLGVADVREVVDRLAHRRRPPRARAARRGRRTARRRSSLLALDALVLGALARRPPSTSSTRSLLDHRDAVGVEHDDVALADLGAADGHRLADRARRVLGRAADPDPPRPDRQPELDQLLEVAHRRVDQQRGGAVRLGLRRQQLADQRDRPRPRASSARAPRPAAPRPSPRGPSGCRPGRSAPSARARRRASPAPPGSGRPRRSRAGRRPRRRLPSRARQLSRRRRS